MSGEHKPDLPEIPDDTDEDDGDNPCRESQKRGLYFYFAVALLGCLVLLVVFVNIPLIQASAGATMTRTSWQLQSYANASGGMQPATGPNITARFSGDSRITGFAGCNDYIATYTTENYAISISPSATTRNTCGEPGMMALETLYLQDLDNSTEFRVTQTALKLYDRTGKPLLLFVPG
ncbi:MAG: META domain-containing protein [Methanoregula sp.]